MLWITIISPSRTTSPQWETPFVVKLAMVWESQLLPRRITMSPFQAVKIDAKIHFSIKTLPYWLDGTTSADYKRGCKISKLKVDKSYHFSRLSTRRLLSPYRISSFPSARRFGIASHIGHGIFTIHGDVHDLVGVKAFIFFFFVFVFFTFGVQHAA